MFPRIAGSIQHRLSNWRTELVDSISTNRDGRVFRSRAAVREQPRPRHADHTVRFDETGRQRRSCGGLSSRESETIKAPDRSRPVRDTKVGGAISRVHADRGDPSGRQRNKDCTRGLVSPVAANRSACLCLRLWVEAAYGLQAHCRRYVAIDPAAVDPCKG